jgi:MoaA/NifB/PqqE/SkfB family radical SAM enzyme
MGLDLPDSLVERALHEAASAGIPSVRFGVTGEPLLCPKIAEWAALAKRLGLVDIALVTNGQLLTKALGRALIEAGLTRLMVSADAGSPEVYSKVRRGGDLQRLVGNLTEFLKIRDGLNSPLPVVRASFVEMDVNIHDRGSFIRLFSPLSDWLAFQDYQNLAPLGGRDPGHDPGNDPGNDQGHDPGNDPEKGHGLAEGDRLGAAVRRPGFCPEPFTRLALHADGGLFPCCSDWGRLSPVGRYPETSLLEAWGSKVSLSLRRADNNINPHPSCSMCMGLSSMEGKGGGLRAAAPTAPGGAGAQAPA